MIRQTLLVLVTMTAAVGCGTESALPFYTDATFTPAWRATEPRPAEFSLRTQDDRPFTGADLEGRIHIASFIYTRCSAVCPVLVQRLSRVQASLAPGSDIRLVSYSVTPEEDSPAVLSAFGQSRGIDADRWTLLTGSRAQIFRLAREYYFADDGRYAGTAYDFLHTEKVLLVDRAGRLRGVYNGTIEADMDRLIADAAQLAAGT